MIGRRLRSDPSTVGRKTAGGTRIPTYSRFAGTYGAAFISNLWYPESRSILGWALRRGSTALASSVGFNVFQEFAHRKLENALHISNRWDEKAGLRTGCYTLPSY